MVTESHSPHRLNRNKEALRYRRGSRSRRPRIDQYKRECGFTALKEEEEKYLKRVDELEKEIAKTPAHTFAGLAVKLRLATNGICDPGEGKCTDELNALSALKDAERLAGGAS